MPVAVVSYARCALSIHCIRTCTHTHTSAHVDTESESHIHIDKETHTITSVDHANIHNKSVLRVLSKNSKSNKNKSQSQKQQQSNTRDALSLPCEHCKAIVYTVYRPILARSEHRWAQFCCFFFFFVACLPFEFHFDFVCIHLSFQLCIEFITKTYARCMNVVASA